MNGPAVEKYWMRNHPVLKVLSARRNCLATGRGIHDGHRVGLAVEGGGMRGIISAAMLAAVEELGFAECFDAIYGFSAGAVNAAYFFSGNCRERLSAYYNDIPSGSYIDFRRLAKGKSFLDIDALFDELICRQRPLDYEAITRSHREFHIGITNVDALETEDVFEFSSRDDLVDSLRASCWMPISSFHTAIWRNHRAMDGSVLTGHPLQIAINNGCSHVLSLSTRPIRQVGFRGPQAAQFLGALHLERMKRRLGVLYYKAANEYWRNRSEMHRERLDPQDGPYVLDLAPLPHMPQIRYYELDSGRLLGAAVASYNLVGAVLGSSIPSSLEAFRLDDPVVGSESELDTQP